MAEVEVGAQGVVDAGCGGGAEGGVGGCWVGWGWGYAEGLRTGGLVVVMGLVAGWEGVLPSLLLFGLCCSEFG